MICMGTCVTGDAPVKCVSFGTSLSLIDYFAHPPCMIIRSKFLNPKMSYNDIITISVTDKSL